MTIVEQIHQEFFTDSEKIINEVVTSKAKTLYELGFTSSEETKAFDPEKEKLKKLIIHYQYHYPNNKFITDEEVTRICKKYNLICGPVSAYTGKVPDSKVAQIASFELHFTDDRDSEYEYTLHYYNLGGEFLTKSSKIYKSLPKVIRPKERLSSRFQANEYLNKIYKTQYTYLVDEMQETETKYKGLFICAPENEMKTEGLQKKGIFAMFQKTRHVEDPVVLHPCKGGWLILAAWGPEASDNDVVNHKMN
jgi:hypothetical protein